MFTKFLNWLDHRTGCRRFMRVLLIEHIPGGAKWRYTWGSSLAFVFLVQLITGILLMTAYSPGESTAWSSVYFIQYQMDFGWFIRGLHHFGSQTMVVLLGIHMLQVVIAGAHLPPREVNWWLGLLLMGVVLGLSLTGYLLPWDQKGYYATQVATNIAGNLPILGSFLQKVIVGGPEYGHATLSRFYAMHVGILPPLMIILIVLHIVVFRRHGVTTPANARGEGWFWPDQAFKDMVVSMLIFGAMIGMVVFGQHGTAIEKPAAQTASAVTTEEEPGLYERWAHAGREGRGADLDAPADASTQSYPARPEWYFLFLFQLLKYFPGEQEILASVLIPQGVGLLLFLLPLLGYGRMRRFGHVFGVLVVVAILTGAAALTFLAVAADQHDPVGRWLLTKIATMIVPGFAILFLVYLALLPVVGDRPGRRFITVTGGVVLALVVLACGLVTYTTLIGRLNPSVIDYVEGQMTDEDHKIGNDVKKFQQERKKADQAAERAVFLAGQGIPEEGAKYLLRGDPETQGPELFKQNCATCHAHQRLPVDPNAKEKRQPTASDLTDFGSKEWILGLLRDPDTPRYFGHTRFKGKTMSTWVKKTRSNPKGGKEKLEADFDLIAEWLATHPTKVPPDKKQSRARQGYEAFSNRCMKCHTFAGDKGDDSEDKGPDFTGYGSVEWLRLMVQAPHSPSRYGRANRNVMPMFRDPDSADSAISREEIGQAKEYLLREAKEKIAKDKNKTVEDIADDDPQLQKERERIEKHSKPLHLSNRDGELIFRWLVGDDRVVFGGQSISGPPKKD
jgi:quinol-cytochrome oxidoreductase complex cytochrome b subunit/mono/diheme cytochrome c family protein